ncbi:MULTISPECIES: ATP-binding protein [unclassified Streptomyces]|uniref:ATP-binding protein n=1 Tax=unclassified Streptomyces TaxID=2593676 RepID=UPI0015D4D613|nr:ATP-binding protein [Streptomyces sp. Ru87]
MSSISATPQVRISPFRSSTAPPDRPAHRYAELALSATGRDASTARAWAKGVLRTWRLNGSTADDVLLVVAELTANAARHGGPDMTVTLLLDDSSTLRVTVTDNGGALDWTPPPARTPAVWSESGRGLALVRALARSFAIERLSGAAGVAVHANLPVAGIPAPR